MKKIILLIGILISLIGIFAYAGYDNYPPMANKYLMPDGSITTWDGVEVSSANATRANTYKQQQWQVAKWLMPDGSLVSALPFSGNADYAVTAGTAGMANAVNGPVITNSLNATGGSITGITDLLVADGGTGTSILTDHGVLVGSGTSAVTSLAIGTTGQVLLGMTGADPEFGALAVGYVTGAAATADLAEDKSTASHLPYKDSAGNITDATLGAMLKDTAGTITSRQFATFVFSDTDTAVTAAELKKGFVIPSAMNGYSVESVSCGAYNASDSAGNTIVNLIKRTAGTNVTVFTTGANIAGVNAFSAYATDTVNATVALLAANDILIPTVTEVNSANAPTGLTCTYVFAH